MLQTRLCNESLISIKIFHEALSLCEISQFFHENKENRKVYHIYLYGQEVDCQDLQDFKRPTIKSLEISRIDRSSESG